MSIELKLDTNALDRLLGDDPGMRVDQQRAVIANVVRRTMMKDLGTDNARLVKDAVERAHGDLVREVSQEAFLSVAVDKVFQDVWKREIRNAQSSSGSAVRKEMREMIDSRIGEIVREQLREMTVELKELTAARVDQALRAHLDRVERQLGDLTQAWKEAALKAVQADVVGRLNGALQAAS
jgi:hypothetical protein